MGHCRIERVLDVAVAYGYRKLVLGAWGCGAFGKDGKAVARHFRHALDARSRHFDEVVFAIAGWSSERRFIDPFRDVFSPPGGQYFEPEGFD